MYLLKVVGSICGILLFWGYFQLPSGSGDVASRQTLSVSEEPDRIVLGWSGPVQEPMSERVAAAFDRYKADRRRLVLLLNSPGGSIEHGRKVVAAIRARGRAIDTLVQNAGVCGSMCVPIFLAGAERVADPEALFMFHEASLSSSGRETVKQTVKENVRENNKRQQVPASEEAAVSETVKAIETQVTDDLFHNDIGIRGVNVVWLARMRQKISGRDIWMNGQQLVDEGSGIVDQLVGAPARWQGLILPSSKSEAAIAVSPVTCYVSRMATTSKNTRSNSPRSPRQRMAARRARLRALGLRPVQHWVPDLRDPKVRADLRRQAKLMARHPENDAIDAWNEAAYDWSEWR